MDKPKLIPYADISVVSGTYQKDGKERNRYTKLGVLFASPGAVEALEGHRLSIKLDALPQGGEGWLNVFPRERKED